MNDWSPAATFEAQFFLKVTNAWTGNGLASPVRSGVDAVDGSSSEKCKLCPFHKGFLNSVFSFPRLSPRTAKL